MTSRSNAAPGRFGLLDIVVLFAMAVTATAFAAGLIINSGIDPMTGVIAAAALFVVMASSHYVITRQARAASIAGRMDELEEALVVLDGDLQRIDQVEDDVARLDLLNDRVERLDQTVSEYAGVEPGISLRAPDVDRLTQDVEQLRGRLDALRTDFAEEARSQRMEIGAEMKSLEGLIQNLSRELMATPSASAETLAAEEATGTTEMPLGLGERLGRMDFAALDDEPAEADGVVDLLAEETVVVTEETIFAVSEPAEGDEPPAGEAAADFVTVAEPDADFDEPAADFAPIVESDTDGVEPVADSIPMPEPNADPAEPVVDFIPAERVADFIPVAEPAPLAAAPVPSEAMLRDLREAIEANRIDLYVQPIVTLPERKLRFYDASTRIRTGGDAFLAPGDYVPLAEGERLMPRIDNVRLVKCVQLLRRLGPDSRLKGVFCNLSAQSLSDSDFFPELVEFMEENSALADSLIFQVSQRAVLDLGADGLAGLKSLGKLGFVFSLDHVANLDVDFAALRDHFFRYVKIGAETLLHDLEDAGAAVSAADMTRFLDRFDLKLIAEKVNDEASLIRLVEYGIDLAQGDLLAKPRQATPEMFRELEGADAA